MTREIIALKNAGVTEAEMWINSKGGLWSAGVGIVSAMNNSGIAFETVNMGFADSTAGHIFQAGTKRKWMGYAVGLIHEIQGTGSATVLEAMNASIATMLCGKTNQTAEQVRALMAASTMMDADLAEQYGFCDSVDRVSSILSCANSSEAYDAGQAQIKKLLPKNNSMKEVNELLGLNNEASETAQLEAIGKIITARNEAVTALTAEQTAHADTKGKLNAAATNLATAQSEILTATNESKRIKAEALVKEHTGARIANTPEAILKFTNLAIADFDSTKALIEAINLNADAPKPPAYVKSKDAPFTSVAQYMQAK